MTESTHEPLVFDEIKLIEIPVVIGDRTYYLREADAEAGAIYEDEGLASLKLGPDGKPVTIGNVGQRGLNLLARCLMQEGGGSKKGKLVPVGLGFVNKLPNRIREPLIEKVKEISGMEKPKKDGDEDDEDDEVDPDFAAKNSSGSSEST